MKLQILKLLICLFASTFFLFNCSKKQCIDKTEPIIYFTQKSLWSGEDTSMVQNIRMIAADKTVILGYEDQSNHKI